MAVFSTPRQIIVGKDALKEAVPYLKSYGKKALLVTGKHVVQSEMMATLINLLKQLEISFEVFDGITGEPTDEMIVIGLEKYIKTKCEFIIGIGGGSPLDSAKAIGAMVTHSGNLSDYNGKEIEDEIPPIVAIPTTAGTGSEATKFTVITDSKKDIKMLLKGDKLVPTLAVVDYEFTKSAPKKVTAATGLDALTHAIEAYTSKKAFALTDTLAISAVKRIMKYLPIAYQNGNDDKARSEMAMAALEAGICINNSSVTLVHGMSRPIGALFHVPHGMSNAMLLKDCLEFALDGTYEKFANLGRAIGVSKEEETDQLAAYNFIEAVDTLCKVCEIPTLKEYGIKEEAFYKVIDKMAQDAVDSKSPANTVKEVTVEDCKNIYKKVYMK